MLPMSTNYVHCPHLAKRMSVTAIGTYRFKLSLLPNSSGSRISCWRVAITVTQRFNFLGSPLSFLEVRRYSDDLFICVLYFFLRSTWILERKNIKSIQTQHTSITIFEHFTNDSPFPSTWNNVCFAR